MNPAFHIKCWHFKHSGTSLRLVSLFSRLYALLCSINQHFLFPEIIQISQIAGKYPEVQKGCNMERNLRCIGKSPASHKAGSQESREEALWVELWLPGCYLTKAVREGLLASCIHQLVMFLLDSSSLLWCSALTDLCCLGRHIKLKSCFLLTVPGLVHSRRNS